MRLAEWMPEFANPEKRSVFIQEVATKAKNITTYLTNR